MENEQSNNKNNGNDLNSRFLPEIAKLDNLYNLVQECISFNDEEAKSFSKRLIIYSVNGIMDQYKNPGDATKGFVVFKPESEFKIDNTYIGVHIDEKLEQNILKGYKDLIFKILLPFLEKLGPFHGLIAEFLKQQGMELFGGPLNYFEPKSAK